MDQESQSRGRAAGEELPRQRPLPDGEEEVPKDYSKYLVRGTIWNEGSYEDSR
jgi:hypothetical protein